jgi:DNA-binding MarR family transcriptional regulator
LPVLIVQTSIMPIENEIMQASFASEREKLLVNLLFTCGWVEGYQMRFFKKYDLSTQQYNVLRILRGQKGTVIPITSVSQRMIDRMSNTSRLVDKLCIKNLVERTTCKDDRRAVDLKITPEGLELLAKIDLGIQQSEGDLITISEGDLSLLNGLLDKLRDESNYSHTS